MFIGLWLRFIPQNKFWGEVYRAPFANSVRSWSCGPLKKYLSVCSHELFTPKMLETGLPRLRMSRSSLQDLSRAVSCFSTGAQLQEITVSTYSIQLGQTRSQFQIGSKKIVSRFFRGPVAGSHGQHFFGRTGSNTIAIPDRTDLGLQSYVTQFDRKSAGGDFLQLGPCLF